MGMCLCGYFHVSPGLTDVRVRIPRHDRPEASYAFAAVLRQIEKATEYLPDKYRVREAFMVGDELRLGIEPARLAVNPGGEVRSDCRLEPPKVRYESVTTEGKKWL